MALRFQPPSFVEPREYPNVPATLDQLFDIYQRTKLLEQGQRRQESEDTLQYGFPLSKVSPEAMQRAQQPPITAPGSQIFGDSKLGMGSQPMVQPLPYEDRVREYLARKKQKQSMDTETSQAELEKTRAMAEQARATAALYGSMRPGGGGGPSQPQTINIGGTEFIVKPTRQGPDYIPIPNQKGSEEGVKNASDAIQSLSKVDDYFNAVEASGKGILGEAGARYATSNLPGSALLNPKVAQAETALLNLFQFANGGKALTDTEQRIIKEIVKNPAFGPEERAQARIDIRDILKRRIEGTLSANVVGGARTSLEAELNRVLNRSVKTAPQMIERIGILPGQTKPVQLISEDGGKTWRAK